MKGEKYRESSHIFTETPEKVYIWEKNDIPSLHLLIMVGIWSLLLPQEMRLAGAHELCFSIVVLNESHLGVVVKASGQKLAGYEF